MRPSPSVAKSYGVGKKQSELETNVPDTLWQGAENDKSKCALQFF